MNDYEEDRAEVARLTILKKLAGENSYSLNETLLVAVLDAFGISQTREWLREQLKVMAALDVITTQLAGTVMIATITQRGLDHVERRVVIEGIRRPRPEL